MASGGALAELYISLSKINSELRASPQIEPLTTSRLANISWGQGRPSKAKHEATLWRQRLESEQKSLRAAIALQSRHGTRRLHILDLPDEVLCEIFSHVRGVPYTEEANGLACPLYTTKDIKNVRLTCQRFCGASSHLLLRFVKLDISSGSVSRLQDISRHPVIRKSVRGVKLRLNVYSDHLSRTLQNFAAYNISQLRKEIRRLDGLREHSWNKNIEKEIKKATLIIDAWDPLFIGRPRPSYARDERYPHYQALLAEAHEEYRKRMIAQREILKSGSFLRDVSVAIGMMPQVAGLQMCGGSWFDDVHVRFGILRSDDILRQALLLPVACQEHRLHNINEQPLTVIFGLPQALKVLGDNSATPPYIDATVQRYRGPLRRVTLSNLSLSKDQLELVLVGLTVLEAHVTLKCINLIAGTWADLLDVLHQHNRCHWFLDDPIGAECDFLSVEEKRSIFGNPRSRSTNGPSVAECYIAGMPGYANPLRISEDDDADDGN